MRRIKENARLERQTEEGPARPPRGARKAPTDNRPMREREFIGFSEIAEACAHEPGNLVLNTARQDGAFRKLLEYFKNGGFEEGGKSVVVSLANKGNYEDPTLTWHEFDSSVGIARNDQTHLRKLCEDMEIPRAHVLRWFQAHELPLPVSWFPEAETLQTATRQKKPRKPQGTDHRPADAQLVEEGLTGIASRSFKNATDAGRQLAKRAAGHGTEESKATRLAKQIKAKLSAD